MIPSMPIEDSQKHGGLGSRRGPLIASLGRMFGRGRRERRRLQSELELHRRTIDTAIAGIAFARPDGTVSYVNDAFLSMWGASGAEEVVGRQTVSFWEDTAAAEEVLTAMIEEGYWSGEMEARRQDGSRFTALLSAIAVREDGGSVRQLMATFIDITEQKRQMEELRSLREDAEELVAQRTEELRHALAAAERADAAKSQFLSRMSHELRTPLNTIIGFSQLLQMEEQQPLSEEEAAHVEHILQAGYHLLALIDAMLEFSSGGERPELRREAADVREVLEEAAGRLRPKAEERGVEIIVEVEEGGVIRLDRKRVSNVLAVLLSNAVKYSRDRGRVCLHGRREGECLAVTVEDAGIGIPPELQERIFEPFSKVENPEYGNPGIGLGLATARRLVEEMDGTLELQSSSEAGSIFRIELPMENGEREEEESR